MGHHVGPIEPRSRALAVASKAAADVERDGDASFRNIPNEGRDLRIGGRT